MIVNAAAGLVYERGVARTSLDDVIERAGVSKSQLYLYFNDRSALLREVVPHNLALVLAATGGSFGGLASLGQVFAGPTVPALNAAPSSGGAGSARVTEEKGRRVPREQVQRQGRQRAVFGGRKHRYSETIE